MKQPTSYAYRYEIMHKARLIANDPQRRDKPVELLLDLCDLLAWYEQQEWNSDSVGKDL